MKAKAKVQAKAKAQVVKSLQTWNCGSVKLGNCGTVKLSSVPGLQSPDFKQKTRRGSYFNI